MLHFDFSGGAYMSLTELTEKLDGFLSGGEKIYGKENDYESLSERFSAIIDAAYNKTGKRVVVLVDEYEKPIIDNIDDHDLMEQFRRLLQGVYSVLEGEDEFIRFAFLTGVTKLSKMSIFSGLNNLMDISMSREYPEICGITEAEVKEYSTSA